MSTLDGPIEGAVGRAIAARPASTVQVDERESRFRILAGTAIALTLLVAAFGLAWDIRWHTVGGRDTFLTPPHMLLYTGIGVAGLLALGVVLLESLRYHLGSPAVSAQTTTRVFGVFHAPLGFVVTGFGVLILLVAAPLDNYWHELYGLDVTIWAPFHIMGLAGGVVAGIGVTHIAASEAARSRADRRYLFKLFGFTGIELALLLAVSMVTGTMTVISQPATNLYPTTQIGPFEFLTYPVLLALFMPITGVAALAATHRPGAATLSILFYATRQVAYAALVPWTIWWQIGGDTSNLRMQSWRPGLSMMDVLVPMLLVVPMLALDLLYAYWERRSNSGGSFSIGRGRAAIAGLVLAVPLLFVGIATVSLLQSGLRNVQLPPGLIAGVIRDNQPFLSAVPLVLAASVLSALLGLGWGLFLREYKK